MDASDSFASLPREFFLSPDGFDAVQHMLKNLPNDGFSVSYIVAQTTQTQAVLDAVNAQLSARVMRSYGAFVHGMAQVQQLESDLVLTGILCRSARRHLSVVRGSMVTGGVRLIECLRRRQLMAQVAQSLRCLCESAASICALELQLNSQSGSVASLPESARCLALCEQSAQQLNGLILSKVLLSRIAKFSETLSASLRRALQASCMEFSDAAFGMVLRASIAIGRVRDVFGNVNICFAEAIKICTNEALQSHIVRAVRLKNAGHAEQRAEPVQSRYQDACALLSEEYVDSCLASTFRALLGVLHSHRKMVAWLQMSLDEANSVAKATQGRLAGAKSALIDVDGASRTRNSINDSIHAETELTLAAQREKEVATTQRRAVHEAAEAVKMAAESMGSLDQVLMAAAQARPSVWDLIQRRVAIFVSAGEMVARISSVSPVWPHRFTLALNSLFPPRTSLVTVPMNGFTVEQFIGVACAVKRFLDIGESFSGRGSVGLRTAVKHKCKSFIASFHRAKLAELFAALQTETWRQAALQPGFMPTPIKELKHIVNPSTNFTPQLQCYKMFLAPLAPTAVACEYDASLAMTPSFGFNTCLTSKPENLLDDAALPFPSQYACAEAVTTRSGDFAASPGAGSVAERLAESVTGTECGLQANQCTVNISEAHSPGHVGDLITAESTSSAGDGELERGAIVGNEQLLCTTALSVARFTGLYVRLIQGLPSLASEGVRALRGLYELYFCVVLCTFHVGAQVGSSSFDEAASTGEPSALQAAMKALHTALRTDDGGGGGGSIGAKSRSGDSTGNDEPELDLMHDVKATFRKISIERLRAPLESQPMFALCQTATAMESVRALAVLMESLQPLLAAVRTEDTIEAKDGFTPLLESIYREVFSPVPLMCRQIYRSVARALLAGGLEQVVATIKNRSWVPKEVSSQHNAYVDQLLKQVQQLSVSLANLRQLSPHVHTIVLEEAVQHIAEELVDAYSVIKKCNDEGRALMLRDVRVLQAALDSLLRRQLLPSTANLSLGYVDAFVAALSLPIEQAVLWATEQVQADEPGYSMKHISAIVMGIGQGSDSLKKKEQHEIMGVLQELCLQRGRRSWAAGSCSR